MPLFSICPENISMAELGFQSIGDTCESTCFSLYDIVAWVLGAPQKIGNAIGDSYQLKDNISIKDGKEGPSYQHQSSLQDELAGSYKDEETEPGGTAARSTCSGDSSEGDYSSETSSMYPTPIKSPRAASSSSSPSSSDAMKVLRGYYEAFNNHDIPAAVGFLAHDIQVTFPDSKKNWASSSTAFER